MSMEGGIPALSFFQTSRDPPPNHSNIQEKRRSSVFRGDSKASSDLSQTSSDSARILCGTKIDVDQFSVVHESQQKSRAKEFRLSLELLPNAKELHELQSQKSSNELLDESGDVVFVSQHCPKEREFPEEQEQDLQEEDDSEGSSDDSYSDELQKSEELDIDRDLAEARQKLEDEKEEERKEARRKKKLAARQAREKRILAKKEELSKILAQLKTFPANVKPQSRDSRTSCGIAMPQESQPDTSWSGQHLSQHKAVVRVEKINPITVKSSSKPSLRNYMKARGLSSSSKRKTSGHGESDDDDVIPVTAPPRKTLKRNLPAKKASAPVAAKKKVPEGAKVADISFGDSESDLEPVGDAQKFAEYNDLLGSRANAFVQKCTKKSLFDVGNTVGQEEKHFLVAGKKSKSALQKETFPTEVPLHLFRQYYGIPQPSRGELRSGQYWRPLCLDSGPNTNVMLPSYTVLKHMENEYEAYQGGLAPALGPNAIKNQLDFLSQPRILGVAAQVIELKCEEEDFVRIGRFAWALIRSKTTECVDSLRLSACIASFKINMTMSRNIGELTQRNPRLWGEAIIVALLYFFDDLETAFNADNRPTTSRAISYANTLAKNRRNHYRKHLGLTNWDKAKWENVPPCELDIASYHEDLDDGDSLRDEEGEEEWGVGSEGRQEVVPSRAARKAKKNLSTVRRNSTLVE